MSEPADDVVRSIFPVGFKAKVVTDVAWELREEDNSIDVIQGGSIATVLNHRRTSDGKRQIQLSFGGEEGWLEYPEDGGERVLLPVLNVTDTCAAAASFRNIFGASTMCIALIGNGPFQEKNVEFLTWFASKLPGKLPQDTVIVTMGTEGALGVLTQFCQEFHILHFSLAKEDQPHAQECVLDDFVESIVVDCSENDLHEMMACLADVSVSVEGGKDVVNIAEMAKVFGTFVLPIIRTGFASAGQFGFPPEFLKCPNMITDDEWHSIQSDSASISDAADVAIKIITSVGMQICSRQVVSTEVFSLLDTTNRGLIDADEFRVFAEKLGFFDGSADEWVTAFAHLRKVCSIPSAQGIDQKTWRKLMNNPSSPAYTSLNELQDIAEALKKDPPLKKPPVSDGSSKGFVVADEDKLSEVWSNTSNGGSVRELNVKHPDLLHCSSNASASKTSTRRTTRTNVVVAHMSSFTSSMSNRISNNSSAVRSKPSIDAVPFGQASGSCSAAQTEHSIDADPFMAANENAATPRGSKQHKTLTSTTSASCATDSSNDLWVPASRKGLIPETDIPAVNQASTASSPSPTEAIGKHQSGVRFAEPEFDNASTGFSQFSRQSSQRVSESNESPVIQINSPSDPMPVQHVSHVIHQLSISSTGTRNSSSMSKAGTVKYSSEEGDEIETIDVSPQHVRVVSEKVVEWLDNLFIPHLASDFPVNRQQTVDTSKGTTVSIAEDTIDSKDVNHNLFVDELTARNSMSYQMADSVKSDMWEGAEKNKPGANNEISEASPFFISYEMAGSVQSDMWEGAEKNKPGANNEISKDASNGSMLSPMLSLNFSRDRDSSASGVWKDSRRSLKNGTWKDITATGSLITTPTPVNKITVDMQEEASDASKRRYPSNKKDDCDAISIRSQPGKTSSRHSPTAEQEKHSQDSFGVMLVRPPSRRSSRNSEMSGHHRGKIREDHDFEYSNGVDTMRSDWEDDRSGRQQSQRTEGFEKVPTGRSNGSQRSQRMEWEDSHMPQLSVPPGTRNRSKRGSETMAHLRSNATGSHSQTDRRAIKKDSAGSIATGASDRNSLLPASRNPSDLSAVLKQIKAKILALERKMAHLSACLQQECGWTQKEVSARRESLVEKFSTLKYAILEELTADRTISRTSNATGNNSTKTPQELTADRAMSRKSNATGNYSTKTPQGVAVDGALSGKSSATEYTSTKTPQTLYLNGVAVDGALSGKSSATEYTPTKTPQASLGVEEQESSTDGRKSALKTNGNRSSVFHTPAPFALRFASVEEEITQLKSEREMSGRASENDPFMVKMLEKLDQVESKMLDMIGRLDNNRSDEIKDSAMELSAPRVVDADSLQSKISDVAYLQSDQWNESIVPASPQWMEGFTPILFPTLGDSTGAEIAKGVGKGIQNGGRANTNSTHGTRDQNDYWTVTEVGKGISKGMKEGDWTPNRTASTPAESPEGSENKRFSELSRHTPAMWSKMGSTLPDARLREKLCEPELGGNKVEKGNWEYIVCDPGGAGVHSQPDRNWLYQLPQGQIINVVERKVIGMSRWLRLGDGRGWAKGASKTRFITEIHYEDIDDVYQTNDVFISSNLSAPVLAFKTPCWAKKWETMLVQGTRVVVSKQARLLLPIDKTLQETWRPFLFITSLGDLTANGWTPETLSSGQPVLTIGGTQRNDVPTIGVQVPPQHGAHHFVGAGVVQNQLTPSLLQEVSRWACVLRDTCQLLSNPGASNSTGTHVLKVGELVPFSRVTYRGEDRFLEITDPMGWVKEENADGNKSILEVLRQKEQVVYTVRSKSIAAKQAPARDGGIIIKWLKGGHKVVSVDRVCFPTGEAWIRVEEPQRGWIPLTSSRGECCLEPATDGTIHTRGRSHLADVKPTNNRAQQRSLGQNRRC